MLLFMFTDSQQMGNMMFLLFCTEGEQMEECDVTACVY